MEEKNYFIYIVAVIAIVAIASIVIMIVNKGVSKISTQTSYVQAMATSDAVGHAYPTFDCCARMRSVCNARRLYTYCNAVGDGSECYAWCGTYPEEAYIMASKQTAVNGLLT